MKSKVIYWLTYAGMWLLALLPFRALYALSDGMCFLMHRVIRYRLRVVRANLHRAFPDKSSDELREIERKFYHYLCDYLLEEVKTLRISLEELVRRMEYDNKEAFLEMIRKHGGIILLIPHYANFEWIIGMGSIMRAGDVPVQVYKPLHNPYLDKMFKRIRSRFGGYNVPKHSTATEPAYLAITSGSIMTAPICVFISPFIMITSTFIFYEKNPFCRILYRAFENRAHSPLYYWYYNPFPRKIKAIFRTLSSFRKNSTIFKIMLAKYSGFC